MAPFAERYSRQLGLPEIGEKGQQKLASARVLLVGVGGLGTPISLYLTGAGIGTLGIIDNDTVSLSNLHRQVLYNEAELGQPKATTAANKLSKLNSDTNIKAYAERLTPANAENIISQYDIVVDGCDNYDTRYLIDKVTAHQHKPYVYGAVSGFQGQVSVFNTPYKPHRYTELFPQKPEAPGDKNVVAMSPAIVGATLAHEVIKLICGYGEPLTGKLWTIDLLTMQTNVIEF